MGEGPAGFLLPGSSRFLGSRFTLPTSVSPTVRSSVATWALPHGPVQPQLHGSLEVVVRASRQSPAEADSPWPGIARRPEEEACFAPVPGRSPWTSSVPFLRELCLAQGTRGRAWAFSGTPTLTWSFCFPLEIKNQRQGAPPGLLRASLTWPHPEPTLRGPGTEPTDSCPRGGG